MSKYRADPVISDLFASGRGFTIQRSGADRVEHCRFCGAWLLEPLRGTACDLGSSPTPDCHCMGCAAGYRPPGRLRTVCDTPECQRQRKRQDKERSRRNAVKRDQSAARYLLWDRPDLTDKEVGALLGVRPKRAKEARSIVANGWLPLGQTKRTMTRRIHNPDTRTVTVRKVVTTIDNM